MIVHFWDVDGRGFVLICWGAAALCLPPPLHPSRLHNQKKANYNATFWKMLSRSNRTVKTSDWPKHRLQWDFLEKEWEKSPPKNVARSQRTVKTSKWPKGTINKGNVLTIE